MGSNSKMSYVILKGCLVALHVVGAITFVKALKL